MHDMLGLTGRLDHGHNAVSADDVMLPQQHKHRAVVRPIERVVLHDRPHMDSPLASVPREVPRVPTTATSRPLATIDAHPPMHYTYPRWRMTPRQPMLPNVVGQSAHQGGEPGRVPSMRVSSGMLHRHRSRTCALIQTWCTKLVYYDAHLVYRWYTIAYIWYTNGIPFGIPMVYHWYTIGIPLVREIGIELECSLPLLGWIFWTRGERLRTVAEVA